MIHFLFYPCCDFVTRRYLQHQTRCQKSCDVSYDIQSDVQYNTHVRYTTSCWCCFENSGRWNSFIHFQTSSLDFTQRIWMWTFRCLSDFKAMLPYHLTSPESDECLMEPDVWIRQVKSREVIPYSWSAPFVCLHVSPCDTLVTCPGTPRLPQRGENLTGGRLKLLLSFLVFHMNTV